MAFWNRKKKRTTAKPKINASISKVEKPKKISEKHDFVVHKEEPQVSLSPKPKMKNLPTFKPDRYEKEFMNIFRQLVSEKNRPWDIWKDFIVMSACSISNSVDKSQFDEREKRYLDIIRHYSKSKQELFPQLFANLVMSLEMNPEQDFLGKMYMSLNLGYDELKQIFTPLSHFISSIVDSNFSILFFCSTRSSSRRTRLTVTIRTSVLNFRL